MIYDDIYLLIVGTRPNFIKAYPLYLEYKKNNKLVKLILTQQHYDYDLSEIFIDQFNILKQDIYYLSDNQTCKFNDPFYLQYMYNQLIYLLHDIQITYNITVFVFGDVNSTLIGCLSAKYMGIKVIHVESGLRLKNNNIKEEVNRRYTDKYADILLASTYDAVQNLRNEGYKHKSHFVGNIMYDTLNIFSSKIKNMEPYSKNQFNISNYILFTCHRFENISNPDILSNILNSIVKLSNTIKLYVIFVCHPHTFKKINQYTPYIFNPLKAHQDPPSGAIGIGESNEIRRSSGPYKVNTSNIYLKIIKPVGYVEMINLLYNSSFIITDSGGLQEEAEFLNKKSIIIRKESERFILNKTFDPSIPSLYHDFLQFYYKYIQNKNIYNHIQYNHQSVSNKIINILN